MSNASLFRRFEYEQNRVLRATMPATATQAAPAPLVATIAARVTVACVAGCRLVAVVGGAR